MVWRDRASDRRRDRNQITQACGWKRAPRYLIRDRDGAYGEVVMRRVRSMGIRDRPTSPRSPWQNAYAERLIGSIRRECLDHVVVFGERHLRHVLLSYMNSYNEMRTHLSLPLSRTVQRAGRVLRLPILGGLHHRIYSDLICDRRSIRDKPTAPASPWQNGFAERLIGSIRRECVDHIIVLGEAHLRRIQILCQILQSCPNASIPDQGCAGFSPGSANRCDQFTRHPGQTSSSLRPCLSFRYTQDMMRFSAASAGSRRNASDHGMRTAANAIAMGSNPRPITPAV